MFASRIHHNHNKGQRVRPIDVKEKSPAFLFFHGGGFMLGDFPTHERFVRDLVSDSEFTSIFVNYTRAPEAQYPTAINEAYAAHEMGGSAWGRDQRGRQTPSRGRQ